MARLPTPSLTLTLTLSPTLNPDPVPCTLDSDLFHPNRHQVPPMQMLGWEATLGATLTFSFMCVALMLPGDDAGHLENMMHASLQMVHSPTVLFSVRQHGRSVFSRSSHPPPQGPTRRSRIPPAGSGPGLWT